MVEGAPGPGRLPKARETSLTWRLLRCWPVSGAVIPGAWELLERFRELGGTIEEATVMRDRGSYLDDLKAEVERRERKR